MSDTQTKTEVTPPSITRFKGTPEENTMPLGKQVWGKASPNKGKIFFAPDLDEATFVSKWLPWIGLDVVVSATANFLRRTFAQIMLDNTNAESGEFDLQGFIADAEDFQAGAASMGDMKQELSDLQDLQTLYVFDDDFGATVDGTKEGQKTDRAIELETLSKDVGARVRVVKKKLADAEEKWKARAANRKPRSKKVTQTIATPEPVTA